MLKKMLACMVLTVAVSSMTYAAGVKEMWSYDVSTFSTPDESTFVSQLLPDGQGGCVFVVANYAKYSYLLVRLDKKGNELYKKVLSASEIALNANTVKIIALSPKMLVYTYVLLGADNGEIPVRVSVDSTGKETVVELAGFSSNQTPFQLGSVRTDDSKGWFEARYSQTGSTGIGVNVQSIVRMNY